MERFLAFLQELPQKYKQNGRQKKVRIAAVWFAVLFLLCGLISRGIYGAMLPRVEIDYASNLNLGHQVKVEGKLEAEKEMVVYGENGLRIGTIFAGQGETVEADAPLLQYDLEDLKELIKEQEIEIEKLQIQIDTLHYNSGLDEAGKQDAKNRAAEDYRNAEEKGNQQIGQAQNAWGQAKKELDSFPSKESYIKGKIEEDKGYLQQLEAIETLEKQIQDVKKMDKNKETEEESQQKETSKEDLKAELKTAKENLKTYKKTLEETLGAEWQMQKETLEQSVNEQGNAITDSGRQKEEEMMQARRALEDASKEGAKDSSLALAQLEKELAEKKLADYQEIEKKEGMVKAPCQGTVTQLLMKEGERVPDGGILVMADGTLGYRFTTQITKEERKYVTQGDTAEVTIGEGGQSVNVPIVSIEQDKENEDSYQVMLKVTKDAGNLGDTGTMNVIKKEDNTSMCIPLMAVRQDEKGQKYVLVISEKQTVLGIEKAVEKKNINVNNYNKEYASLEPGSVSGEDILIVNSSKPIREGDIVRLLTE